jgi:MFS family permease
MTAEPMTIADDAEVSVVAVRSFLGKHRRRSWVDWYVAGFILLIVAIYGSNFLASPLSRLTKSASHAAATHAAATQAVAGAGLVIGVGMGLLLLAQALGPLALSPADASWLLLTPLRRRAILRRAALTVAVLATVAGALLGVLGLAMAGPYLRLAGSGLPGSWLFLSAVAGAGCCLAAVAAEALAQPWERPRSVIRAACVAVAVVAMAGAVAGERLSAVTRAVTAVFGGLSTPVFDTAALVALALAAIAWLLLWRQLASFPAAVLRADSARSGRALLAAQFLNFSLLFWIAEDNHWRVRLLRSKPWPKLPPALALAWADWRRIGRRLGPLVILAMAAVVPALLGIAITGRTRPALIAAALIAGALAVGSQGTTATKRDQDDPALRRLLGVDAGQALVARAVLPSLLSGCWLALSLTVLCAAGALSGWLWPLIGLIAGPGVAAGVLRLARTARINPADRGPDTPMGNTPPWLVSRALSVIVAVIGAGPLVAALLKGQAHATTVIDQCAASVIVLWVYLMIARSLSR